MPDLKDALSNSKNATEKLVTKLVTKDSLSLSREEVLTQCHKAQSEVRLSG
jgi:hypothetical protein